MKIAILGTGAVGVTLANGLQSLGEEVVIGSREPKEIEGWNGQVVTFQEAAATGELVILAVKGTAAEALVENIKQELAGKVVIDTTNPIAAEPPKDGVLQFFTSMNTSLMELLQAAAPEAKFVKAFNSVGAGLMVQPKLPSMPTMFICGNDEAAKKTTQQLAEKLGWEVEDMGTVTAARALEPLCMLWCIPGMRSNDWSHAFKMLR